MQLDWENTARVVGASQVRRALNGGIAVRICLARDADPGITGRLAELAEETPMGRIGTPEEVAKAIFWLCSDGSSFVTGQILGVNGGLVV